MWNEKEQYVRGPQARWQPDWVKVAIYGTGALGFWAYVVISSLFYFKY